MANPKFTRQHYKAFAEIVLNNARANPHGVPGQDIVYVDDLVHALADFFEQDNPRFLREQFRAACIGLNARK